MIAGRLPRLLALFAILAVPAVPAVSAGEPPSLPVLRSKNFVVTTVDGTSVPLADLLVPGKPLLVEFWATWCAPCRKTLPHLVELHRRYRDRGLVVIGLTVEDPATDREKVKRFAHEFGMDFKVAFAPPELYRFVNARQALAVPKILLFDPQGRVTEYVTSYTFFTNRRIENAVRRMLDPG
ncbi:MAG: hypothetical protein QOJ16_3864 [Acidobacteriota bacterium]|jgi:thiol-disulfide isomerase/thioredoxin|nr:hypothetical protein [Acidobacteriota bacterium]